MESAEKTDDGSPAGQPPVPRPIFKGSPLDKGFLDTMVAYPVGSEIIIEDKKVYKERYPAFGEDRIGHIYRSLWPLRHELLI